MVQLEHKAIHGGSSRRDGGGGVRSHRGREWMGVNMVQLQQKATHGDNIRRNGGCWLGRCVEMVRRFIEIGDRKQYLFGEK